MPIKKPCGGNFGGCVPHGVVKLRLRIENLGNRDIRDEDKITNWLARTLLEQEPCEATRL